MRKTKVKTNSKGITLIALVVTIVVLLILAGVSINLVLGNNGIIAKAQDVQIKTENAQVYEYLQFKVFDYQAGDINKEYTDKILDKLKQDGYINEDKIVNVDKLINSGLKTGKGNLSSGDVYVLEQKMESIEENQENNIKINGKYHLVYYNKEKEKVDIGQLFEGKEEQLLKPTPEEYFIYDDETQAIALKDPNSYYSSSNKAYIGLEMLVIPSTYEGKPVKKIGFCEKGTYLWRGINVADVKIVIVQEGVEELQGAVFLGSKSIETIKLPDSLKKIGEYAFSGCTSLTNITIPASVTQMGFGVFGSWTSLQTINVPFKKGVTPAGWSSTWKNGCSAQINYMQ